MSPDYNTEVFNAHARAANWDKPGVHFKYDPFECGVIYVVDFRTHHGEMTYYAVSKESLSQVQAGEPNVLMPRIVRLLDLNDQHSDDGTLNILCNSLISFLKGNGLYAHWLQLGEPKFHAVVNIDPKADGEVNMACGLISSQNIIVDAKEVAYVANEMKSRTDVRT